MPVNMPVSSTTVSEPTPIASNCSMMSRQVERAASPGARPTLPSIRDVFLHLQERRLRPALTSSATSAPAPGQPELAGAQLLDAIAQRGGLLELEVGRGGLHLRLQLRDVRFELAVRAEELAARRPPATVT